MIIMGMSNKIRERPVEIGTKLFKQNIKKYALINNINPLKLAIIIILNRFRLI